VSTYIGLGTTAFRTFLLPDKSSPRYTACLDPVPASQFSFSPAVCPQGWVAWWIGQTPAATVTASSRTSTAFITTAYCCAPGFSMENQGTGDDPSASCDQAFISTTSHSGERFVSTITLSEARLPAWHISWQATDMPSLSPQPPALDGERIVQWTPGSEPQTERRDNWGGGISSSLFLFLVMGIPLLIVAAVAACLFPACRARSRARAAKRRQKSDAGGGGGGPTGTAS